jgi:hypothetical protein
MKPVYNTVLFFVKFFLLDRNLEKSLQHRQGKSFFIETGFFLDDDQTMSRQMNMLI